MTAVFIVGLPRLDPRMFPERLHQRGDDTVALSRITSVTEAIMAARSEFAGLDPGVQRQHIRHFVDEPFGRRRGRRSQHDVEAGAVERVDRAPQPFEIITPIAGLQSRPGEFAHADQLKADLDDLLDEIDEVLEENAEEFVRNYVQKGGE